MRPGSLLWSILIVFAVSVLSLTADKSTADTENQDSDTSKVESGSSWLRFGRDLANLGLGSLDTSTGVLSDLKIGILDGLSNSNINPFFIFDRFLNQTRSTIPIIANHGNFTLLQAALLCAVGALAAGAGAIALEAFYFKTVNDQTLAYNAQHAHHAESAIYGAPAYGAPAKPAYGAPAKPAYGVPAYSSRRNFNVPVQQVFVPPRPTLSAKRLKPQSLRRTQRRNQRKNQVSSNRNPNNNAKAGRKRRKRQTNYLTYSAVTPRPLSWAQYLSSYLFSPFQSSQQQRQSYAYPNSYSSNSQNYWDNTGQNALPARSDSQDSQSWFNFQAPNLNRKRNMITRNFQRYT